MLGELMHVKSVLAKVTEKGLMASAVLGLASGREPGQVRPK
jgi:hypothetical protein